MSRNAHKKKLYNFKEERNMKLRRLVAIGMTVALSATMISGSVYMLIIQIRNRLKLDFRGIPQIQTRHGSLFTTT